MPTRTGGKSLTIVTGGNVVGIDMFAIQIGDILDGTIYPTSTSKIVVEYPGGLTDTFEGENFQFGPTGQIVGGTLKRITESLNGQTIFDITGFTVPATTFVQWVETNDNTGAFNFMLGGSDTITGTAFADELFSLGGDDIISAGAGNDYLDGGEGNDTLKGENGDDTVRGGSGDDVIDPGAGIDAVFGDAGNDTVVASSFTAEPSQAPRSAIDGGIGSDTFDLSHVNLTSVVWGVSSQTGAITVGNYSLASVERLIGSAGRDSFDLTNYFLPVEVVAGEGDDEITGTFVSDVLRGGDGNDTIRGNNGSDQIYGDAGDDVFVISQQSAANLLIDGGAGVDTFIFTDEAPAVYLAAFSAVGAYVNGPITLVDVENVIVDGFGRSKIVEGNDLDNVIRFGSSGDGAEMSVIFDGRGGNDTLSGSAGSDSISGGAGDDSISGGAGNDNIMGGAGNDTLAGGAGSDVIYGDAGVDRASLEGFYRGYGVLYATEAISPGVGIHSIRALGSNESDQFATVEYIAFKDGVLVTDPNSAGAQIIRLYSTVLGRTPDRIGLDFYVDRMEDQGTTLTAVANEFSSSAEFQQATGGLSNAQFVAYVYEHALGRSPDSSGAAFYTGRLDSGAMSRGAFVIDLSESAEHRAITANVVNRGYFNTDDNYQNVSLLYDSFLDRLPDAGGSTFYGEKLKNGSMTVSQISAEFAGSGEFQAKVTGLNNGQIVDMVFQNTLDRAADPIGRAFYVDRLDKGMSVTNFVQEVAFSVEHYNLLAGMIVDGIQLG
jgi:Ca2+-binding RTX toxin-like protein